MSETPKRRAAVFRGMLLVLLAVFAAIAIYIWNDDVHFADIAHKINAEWILSLVGMGLSLFAALFYSLQRKSEFQEVWLARKRTDTPSEAPKSDPLLPLRQHLVRYHSWLARHRTPWLLITGRRALAESHFPCLTTQGWLDTPQAILVWAGEGAAPPLGGWSRLRGRLRRPADGILLVSDGVASHGAALALLTHDCAHALPVQVLLSPALPGERAAQAKPVITFFEGSARHGAAQLQGLLQRLTGPLAESGVAAIAQNRGTCFDAVLSQWIERHDEDIVRWVGQLSAHLHRRQRLVGLWFAPARGTGSALGPGARESDGDNSCAQGAFRMNRLFDLAWSTNSAGTVYAVVGDDRSPGMSADTQALHAQLVGNQVHLPQALLRTLLSAPGTKLRWQRLDWAFCASTVVVACVAAGTVVSYGLNRAHIVQMDDRLLSLSAASSPLRAFATLNGLQGDIARLEYQTEHGAPWLERFGLNRGPALLAAALPVYQRSANRWLVKRAHALLAKQLHALNAVPLDASSHAGAAQSKSSDLLSDVGLAGYDTLKTWLMLTDPQRAEGDANATFLGERLALSGQTLWPGLSPELIRPVATFYANHLAAHPDWRLHADEHTLFAARQTLSGLIDLKQAEDTLYEKLLADTQSRYADPAISTLLGGRDARGLWNVQGRLPGVFTRQAYEGYARDAIAQLSKQTATQGDWVLGEQDQSAGAARQTPQDIQRRLTHRYFTDFARAWQGFLNRIVWVPENTLSGTAEQLRVYADAQQGPLAALISTVVWQAQAGAPQHTLVELIAGESSRLADQEDRSGPIRRSSSAGGAIGRAGFGGDGGAQHATA
ncbi:MAG: ImcF-related family protein [Rhodocyclaceae bacterium]